MYPRSPTESLENKRKILDVVCDFVFDVTKCLGNDTQESINIYYLEVEV